MTDCALGSGSWFWTLPDTSSDAAATSVDDEIEPVHVSLRESNF
jgi:hypothetical protein